MLYTCMILGTNGFQDKRKRLEPQELNAMTVQCQLIPTPSKHEPAAAGHVRGRGHALAV